MFYEINFKENNNGVEISTTQKTLKRTCKWLKDNIIHKYALSDCDLKVVRYYEEGMPDCVVMENIADALDIIMLEEEVDSI